MKPYIYLAVSCLLLILSCDKNELLEDSIKTSNLKNSKNCRDCTTGVELPIEVPDDFIWGINGHPIATDKPYYTEFTTIALQIDILKEHQFNFYRIDVQTDSNGVPDRGDKLTVLLNIPSIQDKRIGLLPIIIGNEYIDFNKTIFENYDAGYKQAKGFVSDNYDSFEYYALCNELDLLLILKNTEGLLATDYHVENSKRAAGFLRGMVQAVEDYDDSNTKIIINNAGHYKVGWFHLMQNLGVNFDIIGLHWYSGQGSLIDDRDLLGGLSMLNYLDENFPNKTVWITEIDRSNGSGLGENGNQEQEEILQSNVMEEYISELHETNVRALFSYELLDQPNLDNGIGYDKPESAYHGIMNWDDDNFEYIYKKVSETYKFRIEETKNGYEDYIYALYQDLNLRDPYQNETGFDYWVERFIENKNQPLIVNQFIPEESYYRFVEQLYINLLDRIIPVNQTEIEYWEGKMKNDGFTREHVIKDFCKSNEFWNKSGNTNEGFVIRLYDKLHNSYPDEGGLTYWVDRLGNYSREIVIFEIMQTEGYLRSFVRRQYIDLLGRDEEFIDTEGENYWYNQMTECELTQEDLIKCFILGNEYWRKTIINGYERRTGYDFHH